MMRYDIEETAVYDKYVRWCGRTGPRGPSYPILSGKHQITSGNTKRTGREACPWRLAI
jgi:hypothetical protein